MKKPRRTRRLPDPVRLDITKIQKSPIPSKYFPGNFQKITKNTVTISPIRGDESEILHFGKSL